MKKILTALFGNIHWESPVWLQNLTATIRQNMTRFVLGIVVVLLIICGIGGGIYWYKHLPPAITAEITPPEISSNDTPLKGEILRIAFGIKAPDGNFIARSVAPIGQVNNSVSKGININPAIKGTWSWEDDSHLTFIPEGDWPAETTYNISFEKSAFNPQAKPRKYSYQFTTKPMKVKIADIKFYQDPVDPQKQQVVGEIDADFSLDPDSLTAHTSLTMDAIQSGQLSLKAEQLPLTFTYDQNRRVAYFHSSSIQLPPIPRYAKLVVDKGVAAATHTSNTQEAVNSQILIPDSSTVLKVNAVNATIVRDDNDNPSQILSVETTIGVDENDLQKKIHVYQLPAQNPNNKDDNSDDKEIYQWKRPGEVNAKVLQQATAITLEAIPSDHPFNTLHTFKFKAKTPSYLYVVIDKDLLGAANFKSAFLFNTIVETPKFPQEVRFLHKGSLLALAGEKKLTVLVRGVPTVKFSIARVLPEDINHLVTQTYGDFQDPKFINQYNFNSSNISQIFSEKRNFNIDSPDQLQYTTLDLEKYLTVDAHSQKKPLGLFLLTAQSWEDKGDKADTNDSDDGAAADDQQDPEDPVNTDDGHAGKAKTNRLILITDMGFLVKKNTDDTRDVFVQSIAQGTPIANVEIEVLGRNGVPILTRQTDAQGHAQFPSLKDFKDEKQPAVYLLHNGDDVSFMPFNRYDRSLNFSQFPIDGIDDTVESPIQGYVFSDRGIYRPGDQINVGIIVKKQYCLPQPEGLPLEATISDPRGNTVLDQKIALPASGYFTLNYKPDETAATGTYNVELYIVKDGKKDAMLGSTQVQVQEFLPDRLHMQAVLNTVGTNLNNNNASWLAPSNLQAQIHVTNLFGTAATKRRVTGKILLNPQPLNFKQFPGFVFVDPLLDPKEPAKSFAEDLTETQTDDKGNAVFNLDLQRFSKATYQLTFSTDAYETDGGRGVGTEVSALITPLSYLVGYKPDADLNYLKQNSAHSVKFLAINPSMQSIALNNLHAQLFNVETVSTLVKKPDDTFQYETVKQEKLISNNSFSIQTNGSAFNLATQTIGDYALALTDDKGNLVTKLYFSVVGASQVGVEKTTELSIKLDKKDYQPGDTMQMEITAPYTGAGLITIERDKVYAYQWFKADATTSMQSIKIPADLQGDAYVNIAFVRNWNSDEIFLNPLSYSVVPFHLQHENHTVHISLQTPDLVQPGQPLNIQYQTDKPSKIIVFAVDEGILQVANYVTPNPLDYFFRKHALTVATDQIVDLILPRYIASRELSSVGGDGANQMLIKNLNPFKRKTQLPVVYWSGIVDSDQTPRTVTYNVPDYFNGSIRVMAVAASDDAVGSKAKTTVVRGDFVLTPNTPTFVAPNDVFTVSTGIANNLKTDDGKPITVKLITTGGLTVVGDNTKSVNIAADKEGAVEFQVKANAQLGNAELTFVATQDQHTARMTDTLSVRPAVAYQTFLTSGYTDNSEKTLKLEQSFYPELSVNKFSATTNPLILADGLNTYLQNYPYECTEQLVSRAFSMLAISHQPLITQDANAAEKYFASTLQMLRQRQNSDGSFAYWPTYYDNFNTHFASVYAMDYLTEAKLNNLDVPDDLFKSGLQYLQDFAAKSVDNMDDARLQAHAIYVLTRNEVVTSEYIANLTNNLKQISSDNSWQKDITSAYLAASYKLLQNDKDADALIKDYDWSSKQAIYYDDFTNKSSADAQYIILLTRHFPDVLNSLGNDVLLRLAQGTNGDQLNTQSAAYSAEALNAYAQVNTKNFADATLQISEKLANGSADNLAAANNNFINVPFALNTQQLTIKNSDKAILFYQVKQAGFSNQILKAASEGLEINREYRDDKNNVISSTTLGSSITAHVQLRAAKQNVNNVAVVDLLPGGFDVITSSIKADGCDYFDVREDRIVFYCSASTTALDINYQLRAVNKGEFTVPGAFATSMYNAAIWGRSDAGKMEVK